MDCSAHSEGERAQIKNAQKITGPRGTVVYAYRPSTWEADLSGSEASTVYRERVLGQSEQHRETLSWTIKNKQKPLQVLAPFSVAHSSIWVSPRESKDKAGTGLLDL